MNIFDFEDKVRSAAGNQQYDIDIEGLLSDLNLKDEGQKRRFAYLPYLGLALAILIGFFVYTSYPLETSNSAELTIESEKTNLSNQEIETTKASTLLTDKKQSSEKKNTLNKETKASNIQIEQIDLNQNGNTPTPPATEASLIKNASPSTIIIAAANDDSETMASNQIASNIVSEESLLPTEIKETISSQKEKNYAAKSLVVIDKMPLLKSLLEEEAPKNLNKKVGECPKFTDGNWNLAIVPEVGILAPLKTLRLKDERFQEFFNERVSNEKSQLSYQTGVSVQFSNKRTGLYIRPGFNYSQIGETYSYLDPSISEINGDTTFILNKVNYSLHQFNIPVAIGTDIHYKKFSIGLEGGIVFNFLQKADGQLFAGDFDFNPLDNNQSLFKQSIGLGFFGGVMLKKDINPFTNLYIGPRFSFNTLSASSNQNPIDQRYSFIGVHAGVIYTLF